MSAKSPNELSLYGGGGFSTYYCQPSLREASSNGFSGDIGGAFTAFVSSQVGFHIGVGLGFYNIENKVEYFQTTSLDLYDNNNDRFFDLHTTLFDYREKHQTLCLSIPLMVHVQSNMDRSWNRRQNQDVGFYLLTGIKANLLLGRKYESSVGNLFNAAYYKDFDNWAATQRFAGLGLFDGKSVSGKANFGILALFTIEAGPKWVLNNNMFLYTGIYFDYGLTDPGKSSREPVENYIYPEQLENLPLLSYTDKMNLMTIGFKVRLAFVRNTSPYDCPRGF